MNYSMSIIMELFKKSQERSKTLDDNGFWEIIDCIDHEYAGDREAVISSLIKHLKKCEDEYIFAFDDKLSEMLYALDGKKYAEDLFGSDEFSEEKFLCARCFAVSKGLLDYNKIKSHRAKLDGSDIHFHDGHYYCPADGIVFAAATAWSLKHLKDKSEYPHTVKYSTKSHSNEELWK